jgi:multiple sugar transport system permease protein
MAAVTSAPADTPSHHKSTLWPSTRTYIGVVIVIVWGLAPFYWMIVTAFRNVGYTYDTAFWPTHVTMDNFTTAFSTKLGNHFGRALLNSVLIGVVTTIVAMIIGVFAAYALARLEFKGKF